MASTFDAFTNNSKTSELFERLRNWALNSGILAIKTTADPDAKTTAIIVTSIGGKIGAIAVPATNLLMEKDYIYRFQAAGVKAIVGPGTNIPSAASDVLRLIREARG